MAVPKLTSEVDERFKTLINSPIRIVDCTERSNNRFFRAEWLQKWYVLASVEELFRENKSRNSIKGVYEGIIDMNRKMRVLIKRKPFDPILFKK